MTSSLADRGESEPTPLLRRPITCWDQVRVFSYEYTPIKRQVRTSHEWHPGHLPVTIMFILGVLAYFTFAVVQFAERPATESFFLSPTGSLTVPLQVSIFCSHPWACFQNSTADAAGAWSFDAATTITTLAGGIPSSPCAAAPLALTATSSLSRAALNSSAVSAFGSQPPADRPDFAQGVLVADGTLCYSPASEDGILIQVPGFTGSAGIVYGDAAAPRLRVVIRGIPTGSGTALSDGSLDGLAPMEVTLDIEPHQRKSVFIGAILRQHQADSALASLSSLDPSAAAREGASLEPEGVTSTTLQPYMADLFYEGKNDATTAHLRIRMRQYVDVFRVSRPGDLLGVFASVGGFAATWGAAMSVLLIILELTCTDPATRSTLKHQRQVQAFEGVGLLEEAPTDHGKPREGSVVGGRATSVVSAQVNPMLPTKPRAGPAAV